MPVNIEVDHKDKLGRILIVGDCVAYPRSNILHIGIIKKLNPKTVSISLGRKAIHKHPFETVKIEGPEVSLYFLKDKK